MLIIRQLLLLLILLAVAGNLAVWAADQPVGNTQTSAAQLDRDWTELEENEAELNVWDPIEPFNRGMFWLNDKMYFYLLKPVARGYRVVAPEPVRESVGNFFNNLGAPVRFLNCLLQGKGHNAANEFSMFVINSVFGLGGLFDHGADIPGRPDSEDFGQTLGYYGASSGFYLVLPFLGPSNARDAVGRVADSLVHPVPSPYYLKMQQLEVTGLRTYDTVNDLSLDKDTYEAIKSDSLDPYLFVRNAYTQRRMAKVDK